MLNRLLQQRLGVPFEESSKLINLLGLAISTMVFSVSALTLGSSLFLFHVGVKFLPLSYIFMGLCSIPIYTSLSQVVDYIARPKLCRILLLFGTIIILGLTFVLKYLDVGIIYYLIYIGFYIQWILVTEVLYPSLISDYFTVLQWKKYEPFLRMAMAVGGLLGGGIISILAIYFETGQLLLILPFFYGIVFVQLLYLEYNEKPLTQDLTSKETDKFSQDGLIKYDYFPKLIRLLQQYPIILFLSLSTFLFVVVYAVTEFQYFTIYTKTFNDDQALTQFLGILRIVNNILPFIILYFITRPLLEKLGIIRMNLVYPLTSLVSFLGLFYQFNLPFAVFANLNSDGIEDSLNQPIHSLNYNAVPHNLIGRVRLISNGLFYSFGLAISGGLLWLCQWLFNSLQITIIGIVLSLIFLMVRYLMGKSYLTSLFTILKQGKVALENVSEGLSHLPSFYSSQVLDLLESKDINEQLLGLEFTARVDNPQIFLPQIDRLLLSENIQINQGLVKFFTAVNHPDIIRYLGYQLACERINIQLIALQSILCRKHFLTDSEILQLILNSSQKMTKVILGRNKTVLKGDDLHQKLLQHSQFKALACIAAQEFDSKNSQINMLCERLWQSDLESNIKISILQNIRQFNNRKLIPIIEQLMEDDNAQVKREALEILALFGRPGDVHLGEIASRELTHHDNSVRAAAFKVMGVVRSPNLLLAVAVGLESKNLTIRLWAANALSQYGKQSLRVAKIYLSSSRLEVVEAAIAAIAMVKTPQASDILYNYLKSDYQLFAQIQKWLSKLPKKQGKLELFRLVLKDYQQRLIHRVLYVISCLDHQGTFKDVRKLLNNTNTRQKANVLETLVSFAHRRFILPIVPILDDPLNMERANFRSKFPMTEMVLEEAIRCGDRWIRLGALFLFPSYNLPIPKFLLSDSDHLVKRVAESLSMGLQKNFPEDDWFLNQIFLLKKMPLFENLFLDELSLINNTFDQKDIPENTQIIDQKEGIKKLHIVTEGCLFLTRGDHTEKITAGGYFGEENIFGDRSLPITAVTKTDCTILTLSPKKFEKVLNICPRILLCLCQKNPIPNS
jgi:hypothetical protein